jgi:hypothetical protein
MSFLVIFMTGLRFSLKNANFLFCPMGTIERPHSRVVLKRGKLVTCIVMIFLAQEPRDYWLCKL